ncbi:hypothetical protein GCM10027089_51180 [Nocardia thraciensis]
MAWFFIVVGALMVLFALFVNPSKWWRTTAGWQYKKPEANEPSEAGSAARWVAIGIAGIALIGVGLWFNYNTSGGVSGKSTLVPRWIGWPRCWARPRVQPLRSGLRLRTSPRRHRHRIGSPSLSVFPISTAVSDGRC